MEEDWPLFPVAKSGDTYCIVAQEYLFPNAQESLSEYLDYCRANATFRTRPIKVPTREIAKEQLSTLRQSQRWRAIQWGWEGYRWEKLTWGSIVEQAENIERDR